MKKQFYLSLIIFYVIFSPGKVISQETPITNDYKEITIKEISVLIKNNYVLKEKRNDIVSSFSQKHLNGLYDTIQYAESFATQITRDLQDISGDKHFAVVYAPSRVAEMRIVSNDEPDQEELEIAETRRLEARKKNNFGFKRVEILVGNIGYLDFHFFRGDSLALETAHAAMAFLSNTDAIIIDLRNNSGGGIAMFQLLTSYFFNDEPVLLGEIYNGLTDEAQQLWTKPHIARYKIPERDLYILTSKETFSAAEEFAYDLKHLRRATIVGEHSGGGAHMVTRMIINDDFYIYMPFAGAINPITKSNWEGVGVKPDIEVNSNDALKTAHKLSLQKIISKITDEEYRRVLESLLQDLM